MIYRYECSGEVLSLEIETVERALMLAEENALGVSIRPIEIIDGESAIKL